MKRTSILMMAVMFVTLSMALPGVPGSAGRPAHAAARVTGEAPPDLSGTWKTLKIRWTVKPNGVRGRLRGSVAVTNSGGAAGTSTVAIYLSTDPILDEGDAVLLRSPVPSLLAGASKSLPVDARMPEGPPPPVYFLLAELDADGVLNESDESDNTIPFGPFTSGDEYFPLSRGDAFLTEVNHERSDGAPEEYLNLTQVLAPKDMGGVSAIVLRESHPVGSTLPLETYLSKDRRGIHYLGNDDATDLFTPQVVPFDSVQFPAYPGNRFRQVARKGLDFGKDLDGDGVNETFSIQTVVRVRGPEDLVLPAGSFPGCLRLDSRTRFRVTGSRIGQRETDGDRDSHWYAPGVGFVQDIEEIRNGGRVVERNTERLLGWVTDAGGGGVVSGFHLTGLLAPPPPVDPTSSPAIAFDGTNYLVVTYQDTDPYHGILGSLVSKKGEVLATIHVAEGTFGLNYSGHPMAVAFDGTNYLVAFESFSRIRATRVSPSGAVLDGAQGFSVFSDPSGQGKSPVVSFDGTNYLVVWQKGGYGQQDIYGAQVTPAGTALGEFLVFGNPGEQVSPSLAFDGENFLVVWEDTTATTTSDIYGTRVSKAGVPLDPSGLALCTAAGHQGSPRVVYGKGSYLVVWESYPEDGSSSTNLYAARVSTAGAILQGGGSGVLVSSRPGINQEAGLALNGDDFFVAWRNVTNLDSVLAVRIPVEGALATVEDPALVIQVSQPPVGQSPSRCYPQPQSNGESCFIAWLEVKLVIKDSMITEYSRDIQGALVFP